MRHSARLSSSSAAQSPENLKVHNCDRYSLLIYQFGVYPPHRDGPFHRHQSPRPREIQRAPSAPAHAGVHSSAIPTAEGPHDPKLGNPTTYSFNGLLVRGFDDDDADLGDCDLAAAPDPTRRVTSHRADLTMLMLKIPPRLTMSPPLLMPSTTRLRGRAGQGNSNFFKLTQDGFIMAWQRVVCAERRVVFRRAWGLLGKGLPHTETYVKILFFFLLPLSMRRWTHFHHGTRFWQNASIGHPAQPHKTTRRASTAQKILEDPVFVGLRRAERQSSSKAPESRNLSRASIPSLCTLDAFDVEAVPTGISCLEECFSDCKAATRLY